MSYGICFVCNKEIKANDHRVLFGLDGDFIHKECEFKKDDVMEKINNMTTKQFIAYMLEESV